MPYPVHTNLGNSSFGGLVLYPPREPGWSHRASVFLSEHKIEVPPQWTGGRARLFCTLQGQPLKPSYVRTMLVRVADKVGIEKRVHPHGLRHTHSYELMMEGVPVPVIQQQLGHASLATTDRYLRHIAPRDVVEVLRRREWSV